MGPTAVPRIRPRMRAHGMPHSARPPFEVVSAVAVWSAVLIHVATRCIFVQYRRRGGRPLPPVQLFLSDLPRSPRAASEPPGPPKPGLSVGGVITYRSGHRPEMSRRVAVDV